VQITGAPAAGDKFTVGQNVNGVSDNRNALLLAGLQTKNILAGSTATYQSAYSQIASSIGVKSRDINVTAQAQASLVTQTQQAQQSMSGVNLDEEASNLLRFQQAYEASAKMMQIASTLFDTLLSLGR
jgi:flagellar hook-associated protein 1 FlgK